MNKVQIIIIFSLLFFSCKTKYTSSIPKYKIDKSIKEEVDNNIADMNGVSLGNVEMKLFEDDILIFDNFGEEEKAQLMFMATREQDTISITGFVGFAVAIGFYLDLFEDSYELTYLAKSDADIYKYNKQDTNLSYKLSVPCSYTSCILTSKPTFMKEDSISGIVELKSNEFWQFANGRENKYRVELKVYFSVTEKDFH